MDLKQLHRVLLPGALMHDTGCMLHDSTASLSPNLIVYTGVQGRLDHIAVALIRLHTAAASQATSSKMPAQHPQHLQHYPQLGCGCLTPCTAMEGM
jgi:hypothetical protein